MEFAEGHWFLTLGSFNIHGTWVNRTDFDIILTKNCNLDCHYFIHNSSYNYSDHLYFKYSYYSWKRFRLGYICRNLMHCIHFSFLILFDIASIKDYDSRSLFIHNCSLSQKQFYAFPLHPSLCWIYFFVWNSHCILISGSILLW